MKERPILFSAPMVRALLAGRKTQTRRLVKGEVQPTFGMYSFPAKSRGFWLYPNAIKEILAECPYGVPSDQLWVREMWRAKERYDGLDGVLYAADEEFRGIENTTAAADLWVDAYDNGRHGDKWRPSIFMPRWASRITLEVSEVRVERLQDISEADAEVEGAFFTDYGRNCFHGAGPKPTGVGDCPAPEKTHPVREGWSMTATSSYQQCLGSPRMAFANYWIKLNGPGSWDSNPWAWVVSFKRVKP